MKNSYQIWIPSIQNFLRFYELDADQYRCILKLLGERELEFIYNMNQIVKANLIGDFDIRTLTTLDRFVIFLYLKIHSCGPNIALSRKCPKCTTSAGIKMDLNILLDTIAPKVDKRFTKPIIYNNLTAICDIPTIETEYQIYSFGSMINADEKSLDFSLNNYIISHVTELYIDRRDINLKSLNYQERLTLLNKLPAGLFHNIRNDFIKQIHDSVTEIDFLTIKCKKCGETMQIQFDINNINDILKIIYKDHSVESFLQTLTNISSSVSMSVDFLKNITPLEIQLIYSFIEKQSKEKEQAEAAPQPQEKNMFEAYRAQTEGMQESPSEFGL